MSDTIRLVGGPSTKVAPANPVTSAAHSGPSYKSLKSSSHYSEAHRHLNASLPRPKQSEPEIILPDISSEYSDSDSEEHRRKARALPQWAQSPELQAAFEAQRSIDPDDVFGAMKPLQMDGESDFELSSRIVLSSQGNIFRNIPWQPDLAIQSAVEFCQLVWHG